MFALLHIIKAAYRRYKKTFENLENGKYKDCKNSTIIHSNYTPFLALHLKVCVGVAGGVECLDCKNLLTDLMEENLSSVVKLN